MNLKQSTFVTEYLRHGDKLVAYQKAYQCHGASFRTIESAANRLLNNTEVDTAIVSVQQRIRQEVEEEIKKELQTELLTVQRKRELLARIATGDMWIEQEEKGRDCKTCTRMVRPTINQILKAIDLDSKLAGHYTNKKQITVVHTNPPVQKEEKVEDKKDSFPVVREGGLRQRSKTEGSEIKKQQTTGHAELVSASSKSPNKITIKELNKLFSAPLRQENKTSISQQNATISNCAFQRDH